MTPTVSKELEQAREAVLKMGSQHMYRVLTVEQHNLLSANLDAYAATVRTAAQAPLLAAPAAQGQYMEQLRVAVNDACSCGGKGPQDDGVCPACMVWHRMKPAAGGKE